MREMPGFNADPSSESFTDDALALLAEADGEASRLGHEYIGTEHVVLSLSGRDTGVAAAILERSGVDRLQVNQTLMGIVGSREANASPGMKRPYTARTRTAFALAAESARGMGHGRIAVEHLLLGVLHEGMNIGAVVLREHGLTPEAAAQTIAKLNTEGGSL